MQNSTLLDLILINRPRSFMKSQNFETGLNNCQKLVCSILRASFKKLLLWFVWQQKISLCLKCSIFLKYHKIPISNLGIFNISLTWNTFHCLCTRFYAKPAKWRNHILAESNGSDWFYQLSRTAQKLKGVLRRTNQISGIFLTLTNQFSGIFSTLIHSIFGTSCSVLILSFTFTAVIDAAFRRGRMWFSLMILNSFFSPFLVAS